MATDRSGLGFALTLLLLSGAAAARDADVASPPEPRVGDTAPRILGMRLERSDRPAETTRSGAIQVTESSEIALRFYGLRLLPNSSALLAFAELHSSDADTGDGDDPVPVTANRTCPEHTDDIQVRPLVNVSAAGTSGVVGVRIKRLRKSEAVKVFGLCLLDARDQRWYLLPNGDGRLRVVEEKKPLMPVWLQVQFHSIQFYLSSVYYNTNCL